MNWKFDQALILVKLSDVKELYKVNCRTRNTVCMAYKKEQNLRVWQDS